MSSRILAAATDLFSRNAYADVSVDQVAASAGCTKVTVYQHFRSKDELALACLRSRLDRREAQLDQFLEPDDARQDPLLAIFDWLEDWLDPAKFRGCAFVKAVHELASVLPEVRLIAAEAKEKIARRFTALAQKSGRTNPGQLGQQLALVFEGAQSLAMIEGSARPARTARRIAHAILHAWEYSDNALQLADRSARSSRRRA